MAKKDKKIIEKEPTINEVVDAKTTENASNEIQDAPMQVKKLICKQSFTDKFNNEIVYKVNDELNITDISRRNDLIQRGLAVEE